MRIEELKTAFAAIARTASLVRHHQFDEGFDKTPYLNFTFGTEDVKGLWETIKSKIYGDPVFAGPMAKASIVVCQGDQGWDDYLQLFHFDQTVPLDELNVN